MKRIERECIVMKHLIAKKTSHAAGDWKYRNDMKKLPQGSDADRIDMLKCAYEMRMNGNMSKQEWELFREKLEMPSASPFDDCLEAKATSKERLDCLFSSVMNSEPSALLMLMLDRQPKPMEDIIMHFELRTGGVWRNERLLRHLGKHMSLLDKAGFVSYRFEQSEFLAEYAASDSGFKYGQPLAMFGLHMSCRYEISLRSLFGNPVAFGKDIPPGSRLRILELLSQNNGKTIGDIVLDTGCMPTSVSAYLNTLSKLGLAELHRSPWKTYERTLDCWLYDRDSENVKIADRQDSPTKKAARYRSGEGSDAWKNVAGNLRYDKDSTMHKILGRLNSRRFAEIHRRNGEMMSRIEPTARGREFADELVCKVKDAVADGVELKAMQELTRKYRVYPDSMVSQMTDSLRHYLKAAPEVNKKFQENG